MQQKNKITVGIRIASLLLEYVIMMVIISLCFIPAGNKDAFGFFRVAHEPYKIETLTDPTIYLVLLGFSILLCKDCINGQSIAKRLTKLQVVDNKSGAVATPVQCFVRNITLLILPLEGFVLLTNIERRLGDKIAGTKLVLYDRETNNTPVLSFKSYILPLVLAYAICIMLAFGFSQISFNKSKTLFVASSYNETKSKSLEKLLTDSFSNYYAANVKYYDSIENKKFDYISIICFFRENISRNHVLTNQELETQTIDRVYTLFPEDQVHGKIKFAYRVENSMTTWNSIFGIRFSGDEE